MNETDRISAVRAMLLTIVSSPGQQNEPEKEGSVLTERVPIERERCTIRYAFQGKLLC